jgi:hypothetical protein
MYTTLRKIRNYDPCTNGRHTLLRYLGKRHADDEPLAIVTVLESNGLDDALWALRALDGFDDKKHIFAIECARRVQHIIDRPCLMPSLIPIIDALDAAEAYAMGYASLQELAHAKAAAHEPACLLNMSSMSVGTSDDGGFGDSWLVQAVQAAASAAWEAIWVPFAETECDDNPCSRSLFVWDAASSSLAAAAAAAGSCFAEREKAREAEQAFQKKLFVEIFSPERKD